MNGKMMKTMADCAAIISVIKKDKYPYPCPTQSRLRMKGSVPGTAALYGPEERTIEIGGHSFKHVFYVTDSPVLDNDCLLGIDFMHKFGIIIDCSNGMITIHKHQDGQSLNRPLKVKASIFPPNRQHRQAFTASCLFYELRAPTLIAIDPFHNGVYESL